MRKKEASQRNLVYLVYFLVFVFSIIVISVIVKLIIIWESSSFDGNHRFTIALVYSKNSVDVISVDPASSTGSILHVLSKNEIQNIQQAIEIPIDVQVKNPPQLSGDLALSTYGWQLLTHYRTEKTNATIIDLTRFFLTSRGVAKDTELQSMHLPISDSSDDAIVSTLFKDATVSSENISIQIINTTDVSGFGNRLARQITNMGGNVVSVTSSNQQTKQSIITAAHPSYTEKKLTKLLHATNTPKQNETISDMIISLGQDSVQNSPF